MKVLGIYDYINSLTSNEKLNYIYLSSAILFFISLYDIKLNHIFALLLIPVVIVYLTDKKFSELSDNNSVLETKLKLLDDEIPAYFHTDPDMINLFFSIKDFRKYNKDAYKKALKTTDNVLRLKVDTEQELKNCVETFETAEMISKKALNYLHTFIYSIPYNSVNKEKLRSAIKRHQLLLKRNLDFMFDRCKELTKEMNIHTRFITDYNREKPYNPRNQAFGELNFSVYPN